MVRWFIGGWNMGKELECRNYSFDVRTEAMNEVGLYNENSNVWSGSGGGELVDTYTKTQTDNLLLNKVDKEEGNNLFSGS